MKCMSCGNEEWEEYDVKVEGKLYGIVIKKNKEKQKVKAIMCKKCGLICLKNELHVE